MSIFYKYTLDNIKNCFFAFVYIVLSLCLLLGVLNYHRIFFNSQYACADEVSDAQSELSAAQEKLSEVQSEYNEAKEQANSLQSEITECTKKAFEAQDEKIRQQQSLNEIAVMEYRNGSTLPYLTLILESTNLNDCLKNLYYANRMMGEKLAAIDAQAQAKKEFDEALNDLNNASDKYNEALQEASNKISQAQNLVEETSAKLENAEQAAKLKQQAQEIIAPAAPSPTQESPAPVEPAPAPPAQDWDSGLASAYGGSSDPGSGSSTATGAAITDSSMGVAIPVSMPNYRSYFGRTVQIQIGGSVVLGVVNDCGGLDGGSRALDVQPGIFKAFGYSTCQAWGVRNIQYKFM